MLVAKAYWNAWCPNCSEADYQKVKLHWYSAKDAVLTCHNCQEWAYLEKVDNRLVVAKEFNNELSLPYTWCTPENQIKE